MKNIKHIIALIAIVLTFNVAQANGLNTYQPKKSKNPWQIMQTTLYNHFVDTVGISILTPIESDLLHEITPDLSKAYKVQDPVDLSRATTLGEVICAFMNVKYAGHSGETYDYYKYRYSNKFIYDMYLDRYPNSPFATEMRLKDECLKQYEAWLNSVDMEDYFTVLMDYDSCYCPYGGFSNIAAANNKTREEAEYYIYFGLSQKEDPYNDHDYYEEIVPSFDLEKEMLTLITPNSKIGHSTLCVGNMGTNATITVSLDGPSPIDVVVDHGQYKWIDLKNGNYNVVVTSSNGSFWIPKDGKSFVVEDGMYMSYWCDYNGKLLSTDDVDINDHIDADAGGEMFFSILDRANTEWTEISKQDKPIVKKLLLHYIQQNKDLLGFSELEIEQLPYELTDENIDLFIIIFKEYFKALEKESLQFYDENTFKL